MLRHLKIWMWKVSLGLIKIWNRNETLLQFFNLSLAQQKELASTILRVPDLQISEKNSPPTHQNWSYKWQGIRTHFQLPCSHASRLARADWLQKNVSDRSKIILLGDDDYLSVELSKRSFGIVEVADCDQQILEKIVHYTKNYSAHPQCHHGNFLNASFLNDRNPDIIIIDPPYNTRWTKTFVTQALRTAGAKHGVTLLMMLNQKCFREEDLESIVSVLRSNGFIPCETIKNFNAYPLAGVSKFFMNLGLWLLLDLPFARQLFLQSDLLVFRREESALRTFVG